MAPMRALPAGLSRLSSTSENRNPFVHQKSSLPGGRKALREIVNRYRVSVRMLSKFKLKTFKIMVINSYKVKSCIVGSTRNIRIIKDNKYCV